MMSPGSKEILDQNQQDSNLQNLSFHHDNESDSESSTNQDNESESESNENDKFVDLKLAKNLTNQRIISHIRIHQTIPWLVFKNKHQLLKDHKYIESKMRKNKRYFNYK